MCSSDLNELAHAFNVPVMINSNLRDGSLREAARERKIPMLLFEGGEALRHDEHVIKSGLNGILTLISPGLISPGLIPRSLLRDSFLT